MICGVVSNSGPNGEPLACGYAAGHEGVHAWASQPTWLPGHPVPKHATIATLHLIDLPEVQAALDAATAVAVAAMPYRESDGRVAAALDRLDRATREAVR